MRVRRMEIGLAQMRSIWEHGNKCMVYVYGTKVVSRVFGPHTAKAQLWYSSCCVSSA